MPLLWRYRDLNFCMYKVGTALSVGNWHASLEVSEGWKATCATGDVHRWRYQKSKLCYSSGNTTHWWTPWLFQMCRLLEHASWVSHSSLCRMLQNPSWASPSSHCRLLCHVLVASLSSHCRMLQHPSWVSVSSHTRMLCHISHSISQHSLQNVTASLSSHCIMLWLPHDCPLAVTAECYIMSCLCPSAVIAECYSIPH